MKKFFKHSKKYLLLVLTIVMMVATSMVVLAAEKAPDPKNLTILTVGIQNTNKDGSLKYDANGNKSIKAQSPVLYTNGGSEFEVTLPGTGDNEAMVELPNSITLDVDARIKIDKNEDGKINGNDKGADSHIDGEYTVKSSNERVATVTMSEDGEKITIVAGDTTGTATIKLTEKYPVNAKKPKTATVKVTVKELVDEITFDDSVVDNNTVVVGTKGTVTLGTTTNAAASKKTIKYVVSKEDAAYISVNAKGVITAKKNTSSLEGGYAEVQVLAQDQTYTYDVTAKNGKVSTKKVTWGENETIRVYVNDPEVMSAKVLNLAFNVDKKGNSLEAAYKAGKQVQSYETVNLKTNTSSDMHTFKLQVAAYSEAKWGGVQKENAVTFTTSNAKVATVDANGVITGHANGTAKITVVPVDGVKLAGKEVLTINVKVTTSVEKIEVANTAPTAYAGSTYSIGAKVDKNVSDAKEKTLAYTLVNATPAVEQDKYVNGKKEYDTFAEYITAVSGEKNVTAGKIKSNIEGTVELKVNLKDETLAAAHPELERTVVITFVDPISSVSAKVPTIKNNASKPLTWGVSTTLYLDRKPNEEAEYTDDSCEIQTIVSKKFAKEIHNLDKEIAVDDLRNIVVATSSNEDVAEVYYDEESKAYVVEARGVGKATITLTATDGSKKSSKVTVTVAQKVNDITVAGEIVKADKKVIYLAPNNKNVTTTKFVATTNTDAANKGVTYLFTPADDFKKATADTPAGAYVSYLTNKNQQITINAKGYEAMFKEQSEPVLIGTLTVTAKDVVNYAKAPAEYALLANHVAHATTIEVYATKAPEYFTQEKLNTMMDDAVKTALELEPEDSVTGITLLRGDKLDIGSLVEIPDEITVRTLTWSSSDKNSVAVDAKGILTAKKVTDAKKSYAITVKVDGGYQKDENGELVLNNKKQPIAVSYTYSIPVRVIASQADVDKELNTQIAAVLKEHGTWYGIKPTYTAKNYTFTLAINDIFANDNAGEMTKQLTKILTDFRDAAKVAVSGTDTECQALVIYDAESQEEEPSWILEGEAFNNNEAIATLANQIVSELGELGKWANKTLVIGLGAENAVEGYESEVYVTTYIANVTAKDADMETYLDAKVDAAVNAFEAAVNADQATNGLGAVTYDTTKNAVAVEIYTNDVVLADTADSVKAAMTASLTELFTKVEGATVEVVNGTNRSEGFAYDQADGVAAFVDALYAELTESATALKDLNGTTAYMTVTFDYAGKDYVKTYELTFTRTVEAIDKEADDKLVAYKNGLEASEYGTFDYVEDSNYAVVTVKDFEVTLENEDLLAKAEGFLDTILAEAAIEITVEAVNPEGELVNATNAFAKGSDITKEQLLTALKPFSDVSTLAELVGTTATVKAEYGAKVVYYTIDFVMDATIPAGVVSAAVAEQVALNNEAEITEDIIVLDEIFNAEANTVAVALNKAKASTTVASLEDVEMYTLFETILAEVQPYCAKSVTVTGNGKTATADLAGATSEELVASIMSTLKISKVSNMTAKPFEITVRYNDNQTLKYVVTFSSENVAGISRSPIMLEKLSFSQSYVAGKNVCKEIYYTGRVGEMIVTVTGKDAYVIYKGEKHEAVDGVVSVQIDKTQSFWDPMPVFAIGNGGAKTATYKVALTYPVGHQMNPEVIKDLSDFASYLDNAIEEGNTAGYYYTYTAVADGTVSLWYGETTEGVEGEISVSNDTTYEYFTLTENGVEDWTGDKTLTVEVSKGDVLTINVGVLPDADWNYPAMEYSVAAIFEYPLGHKNNPKELSIYEVPGSVSLAVPAGETVYFESYSIGGLEMDVQTTSTGSAVVIHNDKTYKANSKGLIELTLAQSANRQPVSFAIKNTSKNFVYYNVSFAYPVGRFENPQVIEAPGTVAGKTAKGDNDGYYYTYTAVEDGTLTFKLSNVTSGVTADVNVTNMSTYEQLSLSYDGKNKTLSVPVLAGDELMFNVIAAPDKNWNVPAMSYKLTMAFVAPTFLEDLGDFEVPCSVDVTVPAGETAYYQSWSLSEVEMSIEATGSAVVIYQREEFSAVEEPLTFTFPKVPMFDRRPLNFGIKNTSDVDMTYTLEFAYPVGHQMNPEVITEAPATVSGTVVEGNSTGYYYTYTTWEDGTLTFALSDVTEGVVGDISVFNNNSYESLSLSYDGKDGVLTVPVLAGDELTITVATAGEENDWSYPEMSYTMTMAFTAPTMLEYFDVPGSVEVTVPAGETVYYQSYMLGGLEMTIEDETAVVIFKREANEAEDGSVTVTFPMVMRQALSFGIKNTGDEDVTYTLAFDYPLGTQMKPEEITDLSEFANYYDNALEAGDSDGYYYTYTAAEAGTVDLFFAELTDGVEADIVVNNMATCAQLTLSADGVEDVWGDKILTVPVEAETELQIQVVVMPDANWNYPALTYSLAAAFQYPVGSELNPIDLGRFNIPGSVELTVPAGETVYYESYNIGGLEMTVEATVEATGAAVIHNGETYEASEGVVELVLANSTNRQPVIFAIQNAYKADVTYNVEFTYPLGHQMNPENIAELSTYSTYLEASVAEGNGSGYYYTYKAVEEGTIDLYFSELTEGVDADIVVYNTTSYAQLSLLNDGVENAFGDLIVKMPVLPGDELQISVVAMPDMSWNYPAMEYTLDASFQYPVGSELNPISLEFTVPGTKVVTVPAGETVHYQSYSISGSILRIPTDTAVVIFNGEEYEVGNDATLEFPTAMGRMPLYFAIKNAGETDATYALNFTYPLGSQMNPAVISDLGEWAAYYDGSIAAGNGSGYYYTYTAVETGTVDLFFAEVTEGVEADIVVNNNNTYAQHTLAADGAEDSWGDLILTVPVNAGDELSIQVVALPDANWNYPAMEYSLAAAFKYPVGSEQNPMEITLDGNFPETVSLTVGAGETVYYGSYLIGGLEMTVASDASVVTHNGQEYASSVNGNGDSVVSLTLGGAPRQLTGFAITNPGNVAVTYQVTFAYPVGTSSNPEVISEGTRDVTLAEGNAGYYYSWIATASGTMTFTINSSEGWQYQINNVAASIGGELHSYADESVVSSEEWTVSEGDVLTIMVGTFDSSNPWGTPAGTVNFSISFTETEEPEATE